MKLPSAAWVRMTSVSSELSDEGFCRIVSGMEIFPMSCMGAAAAMASAKADSAALTVSDRFFTHFRFGEWAKVREELAAMPPDLARKIYEKMLGDLVEKQKPNVKLDDVLGDGKPQAGTAAGTRAINTIEALKDAR